MNYSQWFKKEIVGVLNRKINRGQYWGREGGGEGVILHSFSS